MIRQFFDDLEAEITEGLAQQESVSPDNVRVSTRLIETGPGVRIIAPRPAALPTAIKPADDARFDRLWRMLFSATVIGMLFGLVLAAAAWNYLALRNEVFLLREHAEKHSANIPAAPSAPPSIMNCGPRQAVRQRASQN